MSLHGTLARMPLKGGDSDEVSLSVEESNRLRASLGLRPLDVAGPSKEQQAQDNFEKHQRDNAKKQEREALAAKIQKAKELAQRGKKLHGHGLGEEGSEDEGDAAGWVLKSKARQRKREQELALQRAKELEEQDERAYTSADLAGIKVGHSIDHITSAGEAVLVLKDTVIGENEEDGDELISVALAEQERTDKSNENKKKKPGYRAFDYDGSDGKRGILDQYDPEEDHEGFLLGAHGAVDVERIAAEKSAVSERLRAGAVSLDYDKTREIADYYTKEELAVFKKPKKTKKAASQRKTRQRRKLDDDGGDGDGGDTFGPAANSNGAMDVDEPPPPAFSNSNAAVNVDNVNFVDDDDLQTALAQARKRIIRKQVLPKPEELLRTILSPPVVDLAAAATNDQEEAGGGLVISDTSEFVRTLDTISALAARQSAASSREGESLPETSISHDPAPDSDDDEEMAPPPPIEEEPLISGGLAATLSLLNRRGMLEHMTEDQRQREEKQKLHAKWILEQRRQEAAKSARKAGGDSSGARSRSAHDGDDEDEWQRERAEREAERERMRKIEEKFKDYAPKVDLNYYDDYGNVLTTKQAWNQLAYKFYGIVPGKLKTEKRLKKLQDELKLKQMDSADTPLGFASALQEKTRAMGQAHVPLSVGNHSIVPLDAVLSRAGSSRKAGGSGRRRSASSEPAASAAHLAAAAAAGGAAATPAGSSGGTIAGSAATTGAASFAPVSAPSSAGFTLADPATAASGSRLTVGGGSAAEPAKRERVAFGLNLAGAKRKAPAGAAGAAAPSLAKRPK
ncbi:hypothetical protein HK105_200287 [Polyrhizophydium stewartii]|uniref:Uncharacterized protein n=1 Tax=Polyrhizophydium stewartii TaxID=2732419 RepID=A0ABR4NL89_9FUNG